VFLDSDVNMHATHHSCAIRYSSHKMNDLRVFVTRIPKLEAVKVIQKVDCTSKVLGVLSRRGFGLIPMAIYAGAQDVEVGDAIRGGVKYLS
jgi:hypothetical protein